MAGKMNSRKTLSGSRRGDMASRLSTMAQMLKRKAYSVRELANELGVSPRTIRRDLNAISSSYYLEEPSKGFYKISHEARFVSLELTESELSALVLAEEVVGESGLTAIPSPFALDFSSLMHKVKLALPQKRHQEIEELKKVLGSAISPAKDFRRHRDKINRLLRAATTLRTVRMVYRSLTSDQETTRDFDPYAIYYDPDGSTLKVIGFDHRRQSIIPFSVDHIQRLRVMSKKFKRPKDFDLHDFLAENCFNGIHGDPVMVILRARGVIARIFDERKFHKTQRTVKRQVSAEGKLEEITIQMRVASGRGLLRFVLSWGDEVEVIAPDELRQEVKQTYEKSLALYSNSPDKQTNSSREITSPSG